MSAEQCVWACILSAPHPVHHVLTTAETRGQQSNWWPPEFVSLIISCPHSQLPLLALLDSKCSNLN